MAGSATLTPHEAEPYRRPALVEGDESLGAVTRRVAGVVELPRPPKAWYVALTISASLTLLLGVMVVYLIATGVGVWGNSSPAFWGWGIVNFVFWVGIAHAGTLISAILFLLRQRWRTSVNRAAEAMTLFAVCCAGLYPAIHVGRIWVAYWLFPIPNQMSMWPNFRSPLLWDVFAVSTYATVSALFWYMGMVPDLATFRDRATNKLKRMLYGLFALGWRGSARHWHRFERAYLILAALATPLVLSVHSVVSFDFAVSIIPGWHTTIFPPYFVAGAIFSGFAMVVTIMVPARQLFGLKELVTIRHLENMNKVILATGCMVGLAYGTEFLIAWYSGSAHEAFTFLNRATGPYAWAYWIMVFCNVVAPQFLWSKKIRTSPWLMVIVAIFVNIGMWFERFVIVVTSLTRDYLPSSWHYFSPTWVDICTFAGTFGLFFTLVLLFCRYLPMVAISEVKTVLPGAHAHGDHAPHGTSKEAARVR